MRFSHYLAGGLSLVAAAPAFAQETAPPPPITVTGSVGVYSDYRLRGVSQTDKHAAVQGSITIAHESGFYVGTFASNLAGWGTFGGANLELDGIVGYKHTYGPATVDGGLTWYNYPGGAAKTDFAELFLRVSGAAGPATLTGGVYYAPKQGALARVYNSGADYVAGTARTPQNWDNLYVTADISAAVPKTPVTLRAHLGGSKGNPGLGYNGTSVSPTGSYLDWNIGADVAVYKNLTLSVSWIDTDITKRDAAYLQPNLSKTTDGSSIYGSTALFSLSASF